MDANNKLLWVNHNVNAPPTSGQAGAYMQFSYDANGNMTHRERRFTDGTFQSFDLVWDGADQLRQIKVSGGSVIWSADYNGDGLRVDMQDTQSGAYPTQHNFSWGLGGLLYDTYQTATYVPGVSQRVGGVDSFFHTDWLGSTRDLSDGTGNNFPSVLRYDAFGNKSAWIGSFDPTVFQFAGDLGYQSQYATGPEDGPGLQYLTNRYYDPAIGRFISPDPLGFLPGANLYRYAGNDPVNWVDPLGLDAQNAEPGWAQGLENGFGTALGILGGFGGAGLGGGGGFLAGVAGGPAALITGGAGAAEGWALGTAGGYASGRLLGKGIADTVQYFAARGHGGGNAGRGGSPPQGPSSCPPGRVSFRGLVGKQFEQALSSLFNNTGEFREWNGAKLISFDGRIGSKVWYEAKSGNYWNYILSKPGELQGFRDQVVQQLKAVALNGNGVSYRLISNTPIPESIKQWLNGRGVTYFEFLH